MEKENVLDMEQERTEREENGGAISARDTKGSAVRKKFKDENALLNAYGALEAEFTRRSQRLKVLERKLADLETAEMPQEQGDAAEMRGALEISAHELSAQPYQEKTVEPAEEISVGDGREPIAEENSEAKSEESEVRKNGLEKLSSNGAEADERLEAQRAEGSFGATELSEEEIYRRAVACENVRLKIIGEYFESLKKSGAPLVRGGKGTMVSPPARANSVADAGNMALTYFKGIK